MSTICKYAVRWGAIKTMPFTDIMQNDIEKDVRTITRSQIPQPGLRGHVHLSDRLSRGRGAAAPHLGQNKRMRHRHQRHAQEGPGRGIEAARVVDQVTRGHRAPNRRTRCRANSCSPTQKTRRTHGWVWGRHGRTQCSNGSRHSPPRRRLHSLASARPSWNIS